MKTRQKRQKKNITILEICSDRQVNKPMNRRTCWQKNYVAATTTTMYAMTIYYNNRNTCNLKLLCTWANVFSLLEASEPSLFVCLSLLCWVALHWLTDCCLANCQHFLIFFTFSWTWENSFAVCNDAAQPANPAYYLKLVWKFVNIRRQCFNNCHLIWNPNQMGFFLVYGL